MCVIVFCVEVLNAIMFAVSVMGNYGTFNKPWKQMLTDFEFLYHMGYLIVSMLGLCLHELFFSLLVGGAMCL